MNKAIELEILKALAAGRELSRERILGESFQHALDRREVAFDGHEPVLMPAGRARLEQEKLIENARRIRARRNASARNEAATSVGLRRTRYGWE